MTVTELFEALPGRLDPTAAAGLSKTLQWNITGEDAGTWAVRINDGLGELIPGGAEDPDVTFTISDEDWVDLGDGKLDGMRAFMSGRLKVSGDMSIAMRMSKLFPIPDK